MMDAQAQKSIIYMHERAIKNNKIHDYEKVNEK